MSYPETRTYWLELTDQVAWGLRRYSRGSDGFDCAHGYHDALVYLGRAPAVFTVDEHGRKHRNVAVRTPHDDSRWPTTCKNGCGYVFTVDDYWQDWDELIYRRTSDGAEFVLHQSADASAVGAPSAPPGAMWDAWWLERWPTPDGIHLMVLLANKHVWHVDSEASNCTRKDEKPRRHFCWVRTGDPRTGNVTVGKNGDTCAAGAGSILAGDYHGFLRDGVLTAG